jgi:hypothetical protein
MLCNKFIKVICIMFLFSYSNVLAADKEMNFTLTNLSPLITPNQCKCKAIVSAALIADMINKSHISAELEKGTDNISIQIEGEKLHFLSGASFKLGEAKGAEFQIIKNNDEQVVAVLVEETKIGGVTIDIITFHKNTGLAVWTKTRSYDLFSGGSPSAQSFYLICK